MTDQPRHRKCGCMSVHRRLLETESRYAEVRNRIENHAARSALSFLRRSDTIRRIPVVVHVIYKDAADNIDKAQIDSQIDVLNADFRRKNADVSTVPAPFAPLVGDARIEFELASIDPSGAPTDGITRTKTSKDDFGTDDGVKFDGQGGKSAWPTDQYLNIWVCRLNGGLLGYAQFPGGPAETDGVVCTTTAFGTTGTATAPFDKGRTTTHEVGHWLNLFHIWGDDGTGCAGSDMVADTPNQAGANYGAPTFPSVSCGNGPNGDMFMNFMDYVDDAAMVMFSEGQITRMQAALDGPRSAIGTDIPEMPEIPAVATPVPPMLGPVMPGTPMAPPAPMPVALTPMQLAQLVAAYDQLLAQFLFFHQRGMLDHRGMMAWQQAAMARAQLAA